MSIATKITHNTIFQIFGKALGTIIGLAAVGIIARYLGQEGFGKFTTILAIVQLTGILFDLGLYLIALQDISQKEADQNYVIGQSLTLRLILNFIFLLLTVAIVPLLPYERAIKIGVIVMTLSNVFITLSQVLATIFQKTLTTEKLAIAEVFGRLGLLATTILVVYYKASLLWVVLTVVAGSLVSFLVTYGYSRQIVSIKLQIDWTYWKDILNRAWPVAISIIFGLIYFKADTLILSLTRPQAEVGIYGLPYRILETAIMVPLIIMGLMLPLLASSYAQNEIDKFKHYMKHTFDGIVIIALPMIFGTLLLARPIINLIGGAEFDLSARVLRILIVATGVIFVSSLFTYAILAIGKQRVMIKYYLLTAIVALTGYLVFIPRYTYWAAATITVIAETLTLIFSVAVVYKYTKFFPRLNIFWKSLGASIVMVLIAYPIRTDHPLLSIPLVMIIYFGALYLFGGINKEIILDIIQFQKLRNLASWAIK